MKRPQVQSDGFQVTKREAGSLVAAVTVGVLVALLPIDSSAQSDQDKGGKGKFGPVGPEGQKGKGKGRGPAAPTGPTPRMPDGKVDLQGVWTPGLSFGTMGQVSLQPWAQTIYQERRATLSKDDPEGHCLPAGVPRISPFPQKFVQTPKLVVILDEGNIHSYRQIALDREHPKDPDPLWMGDSIGKWDGNDTLVVDTVGFNDKTWLNGQGVPHSDELHVIERYSRPDLGHLQVDITMEDPKAFTAPHTFQRVYTLMQNTDLLEYVCNEFNVDAEHLVGK
jgi:hypothetical protein